LTSCEQEVPNVQTEGDIFIENSLLSEEELLAKLQADEDAMAFVAAAEELEDIMRTTLKESNTSVDMLRSNAQNEAELEALFGETQLFKMKLNSKHYLEKHNF